MFDLVLKAMIAFFCHLPKCLHFSLFFSCSLWSGFPANAADYLSQNGEVCKCPWTMLTLFFMNNEKYAKMHRKHFGTYLSIGKLTSCQPNKNGIYWNFLFDLSLEMFLSSTDVTCKFSVKYCFWVCVSELGATVESIKSFQHQSYYERSLIHSY